MTNEDSSGVRIFPPAIFLVGLLAGFLLQWLWPARIAPEAFAPALLVVGAVGTAVAVTLGIWARLTFRAVGTSVNPTRPTTALAFGGPYRYTRNPMYLALTLLCVSIAFVANAPWPLLTVLPAILTVRRAVIHREEQYLARKFGAPYEDYKKRVRRWI